MNEIRVLKSNGLYEDFDRKKIKKAIKLANGRCSVSLGDDVIDNLLSVLMLSICGCHRDISVDEIHDMIISVTKSYSEELSYEYSTYRNYKKRFNKTFSRVMLESNRILNEGDKENANKNSQLISTQKELISGIVSKNMTLDYELKKEWSIAHKTGMLHYHDLSDYQLLSINCCLFDMGDVLRGGFEMNGINVKEPNSIRTAIMILSDVILAASSQQFGGFTVPRIDVILAPYVKKSRDKYKKDLVQKELNLSLKEIDEWVEELVYQDILQGFESIEHRTNLVNNSNGQTSFTTFTFGLDVSSDGRLISKAMLEVRKKGLGDKGITAIFPKLVMLVRKEINRNVGSPNFDIYCEAIKVAMVRIYPDFLSLDEGYLGEVFDKYGQALSPMGCRAYLSIWENGEGEAVFEGRANCGAISMNLPRYSILSGEGIERGSQEHIDRFYGYVSDYLEVIFKSHFYKYEKMCKQKASSNPLFFCEGGCHIRLKPNEVIKRAIDTFTWSIGYIGLDEVSRYVTGKGLHEESAFAEGLLDFINLRIEEAKVKYGLMFALYATPAEGLADRFLKIDRKDFGVIEGITDKDYYTNSFHIQVREKLVCIDKIDVEMRMFEKSKGGRIIYNEFPHTENFEAIKSIVDYAMDKGAYYGLNLALDTCMDCGEKGEFENHICPKCFSRNILEIGRVCGYLGYVNRFNEGKLSEYRERVDHFGE